MLQAITAQDRKLIEAAKRIIRKNYRKKRHSVGAAVLCGSGKIYAGVNVESCGYGPCAEPVALGMAISSGERVFRKIVAVKASDRRFAVLPPCGNCRQLLFDYAPEIEVLLPGGKQVVKARAKDLLPDAYNHFE
jgi:cytidine deaminase